MATVTAQILVGHPDAFHAGIWPTHGLYLFENARPFWVLAPLGLQLEEGSSGRAYTWLPTPDHLLEDGLTMLYLYAVRDPGVRALAPRSLSDQDTWRDLGVATRAVERADLARACRASAARCKVVVTLLEGSSLAGRLGLLEEYPVDLEVCTSRFVREVEGWRGEVVRRGTL